MRRFEVRETETREGAVTYIQTQIYDADTGLPVSTPEVLEAFTKISATGFWVKPTLAALEMGYFGGIITGVNGGVEITDPGIPGVKATRVMRVPRASFHALYLLD